MKSGFRNILHVLARRQVEFIVVGGVGAVLHGAPLATLDLDIVHRRTPENVSRLQAALEELDAIYRPGSERSLRPSTDALAGAGHHLLQTLYGPLDVWGTIGENQGYDELTAHSEDMLIGGAGIVEVLGLETLIALKRQAGQPRDLWAVALLEAVGDEKSRRSQ
jgi:hypothetical protein